MSSTPDRPMPVVNPRPGVLKVLGICNIVFASLTIFCLAISTIWLVAAMAIGTKRAEAKVEVVTAPGQTSGPPMVAAFNPLMGMDDPGFIRFSIVENGLSLLTNGWMFVTGIGLINRRRWAARHWSRLAWVKVVLGVVLWGYYIVAVAPGFSESMARNVVAMFPKQAIAQGRAPSVADLTRVYSIMNLVVAIGAIVVSSAWPLVSLWVLNRPGVDAAILDDTGPVEDELP